MPSQNQQFKSETLHGWETVVLVGECKIKFVGKSLTLNGQDFRSLQLKLCEYFCIDQQASKVEKQL